MVFCPYIFLCSTIFLCFLFSLFCVGIVSYCPYYSSSHASVKVREGSNYWGPLGYEALTFPQSSQSPDPRTASKRARLFTFRKRKDSKIPLCQGQQRWDVVFYLCVYQKGTREKQISHNLQSVSLRAQSSQPSFIYLFSSCRVHDERVHCLSLCRVSAEFKCVGWSSQAGRAEHSESGWEGTLWRYQGAVARDFGKPHCKFQVTADSSAAFCLKWPNIVPAAFLPLLLHLVSFLADTVSPSAAQREHSRPLCLCWRGFVKHSLAFFVRIDKAAAINRKHFQNFLCNVACRSWWRTLWPQFHRRKLREWSVNVWSRLPSLTTSGSKNTRKLKVTKHDIT